MKSAKRSKYYFVLSSLFALSLSASHARADVVVISSPAAFGGSSTIVTFTGLADGTEVNGLLFGGILFTYSLGPGNVVIDGGPGITNNVILPNIVTSPEGSPAGILTLVFPSFETIFGYGFAVLNTVPVPNATTITLFSGAVNVGTLSYTGFPDPTFAGGFAGIQSTVPFDRAQLTFNSVAAPAFAVDNIRFDNLSTVPEPGAIVLVGTGLVAIAMLSRRRRSSDRSPF